MCFLVGVGIWVDGYGCVCFFSICCFLGGCLVLLVGFVFIYCCGVVLEWVCKVFLLDFCLNLFFYLYEEMDIFDEYKVG